MASQSIPESYAPLVELLEDAADGARDHGTNVDLAQNVEAKIRPDLTALVGVPAGPGGLPAAVPGLKDLWNNAKMDKVTKSRAHRAARNAGRAVASACVNVLKPRLGNQWNNEWQGAGFTNASLEIPSNPLTLLQQLRSYFANHPTHEVPDLGVGMAATAAACEAAAQAISDASTLSNQANTNAGLAKLNLETGISVARKRLSGLRTELMQLLGPDDERWYLFGFDRPSDPETPEVPENLTGVPGAAGSGNLFCDWDNARRAECYRSLVTPVADSTVVQEKLSQESEAHFTGLPLNTALRLTVTAMNDAGESQPSEPLDFTLT